MAKFDPQKWEAQFKNLNEKHERGEISYDELVNQGNAGLRKMEKQCRHKHTSTENFKNGAWIEWCETCGAKVNSGGSGQLVGATSGSNCVVLALALISVAGAGIWCLIEAARAIFA